MYDFIFYEVRDVMTRDPVTVTPAATIGAAGEIFERHDFNGLPVIDRSARLLGLVTKLDILKAFIFRSESKVPPYETLMGHPVTEVMTRRPDMVEPTTPLTRVLRRMILTRHKSFPVLENEILVGMIAREDVLRALRLAAREEMPERLLS